jgi:hypothetical protein
MQNLDYDDPAVKNGGVRNVARKWSIPCWTKAQSRRGWRVARLAHRTHVSLWAVESLRFPGNVGCWVICGDLPTDYISAGRIKHPREAMRAFSQRRKNVSASMRTSLPHPEIAIGPPNQASALVPLLESRLRTLAEWAEDDNAWGPEYD